MPERGEYGGVTPADLEDLHNVDHVNSPAVGQVLAVSSVDQGRPTWGAAAGGSGGAALPDRVAAFRGDSNVTVNANVLTVIPLDNTDMDPVGSGLSIDLAAADPAQQISVVENGVYAITAQVDSGWASDASPDQAFFVITDASPENPAWPITPMGVVGAVGGGCQIWYQPAGTHICVKVKALGGGSPTYDISYAGIQVQRLL